MLTEVTSNSFSGQRRKYVTSQIPQLLSSVLDRGNDLKQGPHTSVLIYILSQNQSTKKKIRLGTNDKCPELSHYIIFLM